LFSNAGILEDDLLWSFNGVALEDDPYALEKAKAALVDGEAMVLGVLRNGQEISITLPPEVMLTRP
jgi:S1-C subfamily serine protease